MKFTVAVLMGLVSAHPLVEKAKHMCPFQAFLEKHHVSNPPKKCEGRDETQMMGHREFTRKFIYTILNAWIKGMYDDHRANPLDQRCMGDWMEADHKYIHNIYHRLFHDGDIFGISHDEFKTTTNLMWDGLFKNIEYCGIYRLAHDKYSYCMDNYKDCMYHVDMADRIYDNIFKLAMLAFQEWKLIKTDDSCATDTQVLGETSEFVQKLAEMEVIYKGFEGKWDQNAVINDKLTFKDMWHNYHNFKKEHTHDLEHHCPMKKLWKKFMGDITPEQVFEEVMKMLPPMPHFEIPKHHIHHAQKMYHQWGQMSMPTNPFEQMWMPRHHQRQHSAWNFQQPHMWQMPQMSVPQMHMPTMEMPQVHMPHLF